VPAAVPNRIGAPLIEQKATKETKATAKNGSSFPSLPFVQTPSLENARRETIR
jgi:hypothetical protein